MPNFCYLVFAAVSSIFCEQRSDIILSFTNIRKVPPENQRVQRRMVLVVIFFVFLKLFFFCFVVALFDLVHDVEAINDLC